MNSSQLKVCHVNATPWPANSEGSDSRVSSVIVHRSSFAMCKMKPNVSTPH